MMAWVAAPIGIIVAWFIMRQSYMRSARVAALVAATTLLAAALFAAVPGWSPEQPVEFILTALIAGAGTVVALSPILIVSRWEPAFSALSAPFYAEHRLISSTRARLRADSSRAAVAAAQSAIADVGEPPTEWQPAREALLDQLSLAAALRGGESISPSRAADAAHRTLSAWRAAIERTRRFFR